MARRIAMLEADLERAEERATTGEGYVSFNSIVTDLRSLFAIFTKTNGFLSIQLINVFLIYRKIVELEEELRVVGNNLKSLEVSEEKVCLSFPFNFITKLFYNLIT